MVSERTQNVRGGVEEGGRGEELRKAASDAKHRNHQLDKKNAHKKSAHIKQQRTRSQLNDCPRSTPKKNNSGNNAAVVFTNNAPPPQTITPKQHNPHHHRHHRFTDACNATATVCTYIEPAGSEADHRGLP